MSSTMNKHMAAYIKHLEQLLYIDGSSTVNTDKALAVVNIILDQGEETCEDIRGS